jgi:hypothetical protein
MTTNPNYALLLQQIAQETNPTIKAELIAQCSVINEPLTEEEIALFDYFEPDYIDKNPGIIGNSFSSYVGVYISQEGEYTGDYP